MFLFYAIVGGLAIMAASFARRTPDKYPDTCVAAGLAVAVLAGLPLTALTGRLHPLTVDAYLYRADLWLGMDGLTLARLVYGTPWIERLLNFSYDALPLAVACAWAAERSRPMVRALLLATVAGELTYNLVPAVGPAHAFAGFPWAAPHLDGLVAAAVTLPRNCMPSLHFTWALLVYWHARGRALRAGTLAFLALTALATVGSGEHYVIDLYAAVPFSFAVHYAAGADWRELLGRFTYRRLAMVVAAQ